MSRTLQFDKVPKRLLRRTILSVGREELAGRIAAIAVKASEAPSHGIHHKSLPSQVVFAADPTGDSATTCKAIITDDEGRVLVLKDAGSAWHDLPGGHIKEGEDAVVGLKREVKEETGLEIKNIKQLETITPETPNATTKKIIFFKAATTGGPVKLSEEHEGFIWAKPSELDGLNLGFWKQPVENALATGKPLPQHPNQKHVTATVLRTARLQSVANWLVAQDKKSLNELKAELAQAIKANNPTGADSKARQQARCEALFKVADAKITAAFNGMAGDALAWFDQLSGIIHETNQKRFKAHFNVDVSGEAPEASRLLVLGATLREQYTYLANQMIYKFHTVVRQGVAQGETAKEIIQRLDGSAASSPVNASCACREKHIIHAALSDDAAAAVDKRLSVGVKIFDGTESTLDKIISAAVNALANMVDAEDMDGEGDEDEEGEENTTMGWIWVAVMDTATCFPAGQKALTPHGYKPIETLVPGDFVIGGSGAVRKVLATTKRKTKELCVIRTSDGRVITCTPDHLFLVNGQWIAARFLLGESLTRVTKLVKEEACSTLAQFAENKQNPLGRIGQTDSDSVLKNVGKKSLEKECQEAGIQCGLAVGKFGTAKYAVVNTGQERSEDSAEGTATSFTTPQNILGSASTAGKKPKAVLGNPEQRNTVRCVAGENTHISPTETASIAVSCLRQSSTLEHIELGRESGKHAARNALQSGFPITRKGSAKYRNRLKAKSILIGKAAPVCSGTTEAQTGKNKQSQQGKEMAGNAKTAEKFKLQNLMFTTESHFTISSPIKKQTTSTILFHTAINATDKKSGKCKSTRCCLGSENALVIERVSGKASQTQIYPISKSLKSGSYAKRKSQALKKLGSGLASGAGRFKPFITEKHGSTCNVVSLLIEKTDCEVFDITVETDHSFIVEGVVVHNCETCEWLDGKQWDAEYEPYGENEDEYPGDAPIHNGCRCSTVPTDLAAPRPGQHAVEPGKTTPPKDISFDDYLSQYSNSELEQAFGKATLANYRRGDITANQLIGQKSNLMTLEGFKNAELGE